MQIECNMLCQKCQPHELYYRYRYLVIIYVTVSSQFAIPPNMNFESF